MLHKKIMIAFVLIATLIGSSMMAYAQTTPTDSNIYETPTVSGTNSGDVITPTGTTDAATVLSAPGVPNTGAGGNAPLNSLLLIISSFGIIAGGFYLNRIMASK